MRRNRCRTSAKAAMCSVHCRRRNYIMPIVAGGRLGLELIRIACSSLAPSSLPKKCGRGVSTKPGRFTARTATAPCPARTACQHAAPVAVTTTKKRQLGKGVFCSSQSASKRGPLTSLQASPITSIVSGPGAIPFNLYAKLFASSPKIASIILLASASLASHCLEN